VELRVVLAGQHVGLVKEGTGFGQVVGSELVVLVERLLVCVLGAERSREAGHVRE
jgi:hypothetical protein